MIKYYNTNKLLKGLLPTQRCFLHSSAPQTPPTGILFMNLGGPESLDKVESFLSRLFSDKDLIPLPFQDRLGPLIAKRRTGKIQQQYAAIGGGSPLKYWSLLQGESLVALLDKMSPATAPHKVYLAFRYSEPLTSEALSAMKRDGVRKAIALSQYPQYSCSTTGSSLNQLYKDLLLFDPQKSIQWNVVDRWPTHSGLISTLCGNILDQIKLFSSADSKSLKQIHYKDQPVLLFSAHSLPMSVVNRGDPYPHEVAATVHSVMTQLKFEFPYRLVWQSKVGPSSWLGCSTEKAIHGLAKLGYKKVILVPVAFTSDHIETLFELDIEYGDLCKKLGMQYRRSESLNNHPSFIQALADICFDHLNGNIPCSRQMLLRCPQCPNPTCESSKEYFASPALCSSK